MSATLPECEIEENLMKILNKFDETGEPQKITLTIKATIESKGKDLVEFFAHSETSQKKTTKSETIGETFDLAQTIMNFE